MLSSSTDSPSPATGPEKMLLVWAGAASEEYHAEAWTNPPGAAGEGAPESCDGPDPPPLLHPLQELSPEPAEGLLLSGCKKRRVQRVCGVSVQVAICTILPLPSTGG